LDAYKRLLDRQPRAYHTHKRWLQEFKRENVRAAMIKMRATASASLQAFEELLAARRRG
jgi:hypothetical protein